VHRFGVATRDRGAESPVYAAAPASAGQGSPAVTASLALVHVCPPGAGPTRRPARRAALRRGGGRPVRRKMVCKGHPCIYTADGDSMIRFASSKVVPCGQRRPRKLSDVHGREG